MATVTVITIAKNHSCGLKETILSVLAQSFQDWELILVIAPSTDKTIEVAEEFSNTDIRINYVVDSNSGIYQAMNQGLSLAKGDFCWFMNAGDKFASEDVLFDAVKILKSTNQALIIGSHSVDHLDVRKKNLRTHEDYAALRFAFTRKHGNHQAILYRTSSLKKSGGYSLSFYLASDFDVTLRMILEFGGLKTSKIYSIIESGGIADTNLLQVHSEKHQIRKKVFESPFVAFLSFFWTVLAQLKFIVKHL